METTTYTVSVTLVSMKLEDDRDIHLVVADPSTSETMIVEFPDVACSGAINSAKKAEMQAARNALVAACGNAPSSSFKSLSGTATLTGLGFFDVIHGQTGVAPNGIELHAILSFSGTCGSGGSTPTPHVVVANGYIDDDDDHPQLLGSRLLRAGRKQWPIARAAADALAISAER